MCDQRDLAVVLREKRVGPGWHRHATLLFAFRLISQLIDNFLAIPEIRALQPIERIRPIEKSFFGCEMQYPKRAYDAKPLGPRNSYARAVIQKDKIGVKRRRQYQG